MSVSVPALSHASFVNLAAFFVGKPQPAGSVAPMAAANSDSRTISHLVAQNPSSRLAAVGDPTSASAQRFAAPAQPDRTLNKELLNHVVNSTLELMGANFKSSKTAEGVEIGYWSEGVDSYWDTPIALITEIKLNRATPEILKGLLDHILALQKPDGSWADAPGKEGGKTVSVLSHTALALLVESRLLQGDLATLKKVAQAIRNSWKYLKVKASIHDLTKPLPQSVYNQIDPYAQVICHVVHPKLKTSLDKTVADNVQKGPDEMANFFKENGIMPQMQDIMYSLPYLLSADVNDPKVQAFRERVLHTMSLSGLNCYQPFFTSLILLALNRDNQHNAENKALIDRSLATIRDLRRPASDGIRIEHVVLHAYYNVTYLFAKLQQNPYSLRDPKVMAGLRYVLACQVGDGRFQGGYQADEVDDGESPQTGANVLLFGFIAYLLQMVPDLLPAEETAKLMAQLQTATGAAVEGLLNSQNPQGGFSTFKKRTQDKQPGALTPEQAVVDVPSAELTAMAVQGLGMYAAITQGQDPRVIRPIQDAVAWIKKDYVPGAGWWSRYGMGYFVGAYHVVVAFALAGINVAEDTQVKELVALLKAHQNSDGGWGEDTTLSNDSKQKPADVAFKGPSHATLTAYALLTLLKSGVPARDPVVVKGINYLLDNYNDARPVTEALTAGKQSTLSFHDQDAAGWDSPYALLEAIPGWSVGDQTLADAAPVLALQEYLKLLPPAAETPAPQQ